MTPPRLSALNGSAPVAANTMIAPQANTSAGAPARCPMNTSGAMYVGVPATSPVLVSDMSAVRAMPKSITRGPSGPSSTLSGLRSRWITPASCTAVSAVATAVASRCRSSPVNLRPWVIAWRRLGPGTYSLTMYGRLPDRSESSTLAVQNDATRPAAAASLANRSRPAWSPVAWSTLSATRRPSPS